MLVTDNQLQGLFRAGLRTKFVIAFAAQAAILAIIIILLQQWLVRRAMI